MPRKGCRKRRQGPSSAPVVPKSEVSTIMDNLGNNGVVLLLFETPSGFAIFYMDGVHLFRKKAEENIWANFVKDYLTRHVIWLKEFKTFKNKSNAFNHTGMNSELAQMIKKWHLPGQFLAVGKKEHKTTIEQKLKISCLFDEAVMEAMWGIKYLMKTLVPQEDSELPREERLQMCHGIRTVLIRHGFIVKPDMVVNERIVDTACVLYDCDRLETKHYEFLLRAAMRLKEVSGIEYEGWSLMKIATALGVVCDPKNEDAYDDDPEVVFSEDELHRLKTDAGLYDGKLLKLTCLRVYNEIVWARGVKANAKALLNMLLYEDEDAGSTPENSVPPGRAGSSSEPVVQEVEQEVV